MDTPLGSRRKRAKGHDNTCDTTPANSTARQPKKARSQSSDVQEEIGSDTSRKGRRTSGKSGVVHEPIAYCASTSPTQGGPKHSVLNEPSAKSTERTVASRNLSACVKLACEKLSRHPAASSESVNEIASAVELALQNPGDTAPAFLLIGDCDSGKESLVRSALDRVHGLSDDDGISEFVEVNLQGKIHARNVLSFGRAVGSALLRYNNAPPVSLVNEQDCNAVLAECLESLKKSERGVVFVVSDFDRFTPAGTAHMVLYKVVNMMQDATLRCAFIGMTTHTDAVDGLEKRIKSRFQPREIAVTGFHDDNLQEVLDYLTEALTLHADEMPSLGSVENVESGALSSKVSEFFEALSMPPVESPSPCLEGDGDVGSDSSSKHLDVCDKEAISEFNAITKDFLESLSFASALRRYLAGDSSAHRLAAAVVDTLSAFRERNVAPHWGACLCVSDFNDVLGIPYTSVTDVLLGLPRLEMALIVALSKLEASKHTGSALPVLFRQVYEEYATIGKGGERGHSAALANGEAFEDSGVAHKAWGRLVEANLVTLRGGGPKELRPVVLNVPVGDVACALAAHKDVTTFMRRWGKGALGAVS